MKMLIRSKKWSENLSENLDYLNNSKVVKSTVLETNICQVAKVLPVII